MKTLNRKLFSFSLLLILSSCATPRMFTTLDVLRPAEVTFAPEVQNVLIVNNAVIQPDNVGHYDFLTYDHTPNIVSLKFDSAALFCAAGLRESLETKEFFNSVNMSQTNMNTSDNFYKQTPLTNQTVRFLCNLYHVDAVLSLNYIKTTDNLIKRVNEYRSALDITVETKWTIHYPNSPNSTLKEFTDEFSWEEAQFKSLPNRYNALVDACILSGSNIAERLIPRWEKEDRYFYTPKKPLFTQAMDSVAYRNWTAAIKLWLKAFDENKDSNIKFYAANNIAIAYEIMGDIDNAIHYVLQAIDLYPYITLYSNQTHENAFELINYYDALKKRKEDIKLLNKQLGN